MKTRLAALIMGLADIVLGSIITFIWWDQRRKETRRDRK